MVTFLSLALLATPVSTAGDGVELPPRLAQLLKTGAWDHTPRGFRIVALSQLADGCAQQALAQPQRRESARACVARALELGRATRPGDPLAVKDAMWLTHLNLMLGASDLTGPCADSALHDALTARLVELSLGDPLAHAPSYAALPFRWPADQTATLASIARYDAAHGTTRVAAPLGAWRQVMDTHLNAAGTLPRSEVTGKAPGARYPRGCAQSFISRYLAEVDAPLAATWWAAYRKGFLVRVAGLPGFREWPVGVDRRADVDSGPIVLGVGAAASALGIAAARAQGDAALATELEGAADLAARLAGRSVDTVLAHAIRFEARWQPPLAPGG